MRSGSFSSVFQSGRRDLNPRQRAPKARALPDCATPRRPIRSTPPPPHPTKPPAHRTPHALMPPLHRNRRRAEDRDLRRVRPHLQPPRLHDVRSRRLLRIASRPQHRARESVGARRDQVASLEGRALHLVLPLQGLLALRPAASRGRDRPRCPRNEWRTSCQARGTPAQRAPPQRSGFPRGTEGSERVARVPR